MQTKKAVALPRDIDADLDAWLKPFLDATGRKTRRKMAPLYVRGLLGGGERKSIQPMAERLGLPGHDQLPHFISSPAWDDAPLWRVLAEQADRTVGGADAVLMVDDTGLPKKGELSVGVAPQYCGAVGKTANCQVLVSLTLARGEVPVPVGLRLFLPAEWTSEPERCAAAGVPDALRVAQSKPAIALAEIDRLVAAGLQFGCVLADAGYGRSPHLPRGLGPRGPPPGRRLRQQPRLPAGTGPAWPRLGGRRCLHPARLPGRGAAAPVTDPDRTPGQAPGAEPATRLGRGDAGEAALAAPHLAERHQGPAQRPLRRSPGACRRRPAQRRQHSPTRQRGLADRRVARQRRAQVLPQQPAAANLAAAAGRHRQGALVLRAGPSAPEAGTRPRRLRGPVLDRPAPARADDLHRLRLPATPAPEGCGAGEKRWTATGHRRSPRCLRSAAPSSPSCSLRLRSLIVVHTATDDFLNTPRKCQGSASYAREISRCCIGRRFGSEFHVAT